MKIRTRIAAAGAVGVLGLTGLGVAVAAPFASAATTAEDGETTLTDRLQAIRDALAGLVTDGTITQEQADRVAETLDSSDALRGHGHGHRGGPGGFGGIDAAAEALGLSEDELRTALEPEGTTLADVAEQQGVELQTLVDALVAAGTERVQEKVEEGRLTQEEADARIAELPDRVAELVQSEARFGHHGRGHGHGPRDDGDDGDAPEGGSTEAPSDGATTESSADNAFLRT